MFVFDSGFFGDEAFHRSQSHWRQGPRVNGGPHRTVGFFLVFAVAESTVLGQSKDVRERTLDAVSARPQGHGAQTRRVDQPPSGWQRNEFRGNRGVAAALVTLAHLSRALHVAADKGIDERRLAHTARSEEGDRAGEVLRQCTEGLGVARTDGMHCKVRCNRRDDLDLPFDLRLVDRVGLGQQHDGTRTTVEGENEFALEAARVDAGRRGVKQKDHVDVRGHNVGNGTRTFEGCASHQRRSTWSNVFHTLDICVDGHVVAHRHLRADVADPCFVTGGVDERTPAPIEAANPPRMGIFCAHFHER